MESEINKQFALALVRYVVMAVLGHLVLNGVIPQSFVDAISDSLALWLGCVVLAGAPIWVAWLRIRINNLRLRIALDAPAGTSLQAVKKLADEKLRTGFKS